MTSKKKKNVINLFSLVLLSTPAILQFTPMAIHLVRV